MSKLHHPNLLHMFGAILKPCICIVSELMQTDLFRALHRSEVKYTITNRIGWALQIAHGMEYLHSRNVIHRDLKSPNVLLDKSSSVKICDFGHSRLYDPTMSVTVGTPFWNAPEVLTRKKYSFPADVFSFAIILWELLTEEEPYKGMSITEVMEKVGSENFRLSTSACPFFATKLLSDCWHTLPEMRPSFLKITETLRRVEIPQEWKH